MCFRCLSAQVLCVKTTVQVCVLWLCVTTMSLGMYSICVCVCVCGLPLRYTSSCSAVVKLAQQEASCSIWSTRPSSVFSTDSVCMCVSECVSAAFTITWSQCECQHKCVRLCVCTSSYAHKRQLQTVNQHSIGLSSLISAMFAGTIAGKSLR